LDLFVKVDLLLSDDIQILDLIANDSLSIRKGGVDLADLLLDFFDLHFGFFKHIVAILNLTVQIVGQILSLSLLKILQEQLLLLQ